MDFHRTFQQGFTRTHALMPGIGGLGTAPIDTLESIEVPTPATFVPMTAAARHQMTAIGHYSISGPQDVTDDVMWTSGTPAVATISNALGTQGEVTAVSANNGVDGAATTTLITATLGAISGSATLPIDVRRDTHGERYPNVYQWTLLGKVVDDTYIGSAPNGTTILNWVPEAGGVGLVLVPNATPLYNQAVSGWALTGVGLDGTALQRFAVSTGVGPDPATVDQFWGYYASATALPAADRQIFGLGSNTNVFYITNGTLQIAIAGFVGNDTITRPDLDDRIHPMGVLRDNTNSRVGFFTDEAATMTSGFAAGNDGVKGYGSAGAGTPTPSACIYHWRMTGANARMTNAQIGAMYKSCAWPTPY